MQQQQPQLPNPHAADPYGYEKLRTDLAYRIGVTPRYVHAIFGDDDEWQDDLKKQQGRGVRIVANAELYKEACLQTCELCGGDSHLVNDEKDTIVRLLDTVYFLLAPEDVPFDEGREFSLYEVMRPKWGVTLNMQDSVVARIEQYAQISRDRCVVDKTKHGAVR